MKSSSESLVKMISVPSFLLVHAIRNDQSATCLAVVLLLFACCTLPAQAQSLLHTSSVKNISSNHTLIDIKELNGNSSAVVFAEISQQSKVKNVNPIGVWYTGKQWSVLNQNLAPMPEGVSFLITYCIKPNENCFTRSVNTANSFEYYVDHPQLNGNSKAQIRLSQNWNPNGNSGVYNNALMFYAYDDRQQKWYLANQDKSILPANSAFNIQVQLTTADVAVPNPGTLVPKNPDPLSKPDVEIVNKNDPPVTNVTTTPQNTQVILDTDFKNWGFEYGRKGWAAEGKAFELQPTYGDNVLASRVRADFKLERGGLGGDYWRNLPYPIGHKGNYWIGTFEAEPKSYSKKVNSVYVDEIIGSTQGDGPIGKLTSPAFKVTKAWCDFLIGGGSNRALLRVELQVLQDDGSWRPMLSRTSFRDSELMYRAEFSMGEFRGKTARIQIIDNASEAWGHINVDDFRFLDALPGGIRMRAGTIRYRIDEDAPVWGAADTHEHPFLENAHGGNVVKGKLSGTPNAETLPLNGWPEFQHRPAFDRGDYTKIYDAWLKRAHQGGLRLMSGLAVNNWMFAAAAVKQLIKGDSGVWDDRSVSKAQIIAMKVWAARPDIAGWLGIATTPAEARRLIHDNKLALVLGIEVDLLGNFVDRKTEVSGTQVLPGDLNLRRRLIGTELDQLMAAGVRQVTPIHYVSEPWGGAAIFNRWFNEQNRLFTGKNVVAETGAPWGIRYRINNDQWGLVDILAREVVTGQPSSAAKDESWDRVSGGHVNSAGLTPTGEILLEEMAKRGMIIDVEHASYKTADGFFRVAKSKLNGYPIISSHTDMGQLSFTGTGEWKHDSFNNLDDQNLASFGTTLHSNLRHEGQATDQKLQSIKDLGGTLGIIMLPYRKYAFQNEAYVFNNNDGSTKTWAQMYLYGINFMDGKNVAFCLDQGFVKSLSPRFGLNSAYTLGTEFSDALKKTTRLKQTLAQTNGITYDTPVKYNKPTWIGHGIQDGSELTTDWPRFRKPDEAHNFAFDDTGKEDTYVDGWIALNAFKAGRNPWREGEELLPISGYAGHPGRIKNYVRGFNIPRGQFSKVHDYCGSLDVNCPGATKHELIAAYCVANGISPSQLPEFRNDAWVAENYGVLKTLWDHWENMEGERSGNREFPLRRYKFGDAEWDYNMDGLAHYGLIPDFFQDFYNVMKERLGNNRMPAALLSPLFHSAEDYIRMWERADNIKGTIK